MKNGYKIYDTNSAPEAAKGILQMVQDHYQFIPNALGAMAESPEVVKAYLELDGLVQQNSLDDVQRHIAFLTITREYDCSYCVAAHSAFAQMGKVNPEYIQQVRENKSLSDAKLNALQEFTSKLVQTGCDVSDRDIENFLAHGYTRRHILDIVMMMSNKLIAVFANRIMGTDLDEALQPAKWSKVA
ncbi:MAG: carboxymuconolactone decarboxylase family protein [Gammaproteobacteria bacterium]|nr:carboxymuconolactone decarboxylase family protein [Gammaproteobacteria bacterium]MDH5776969.1 carboxymuconolactone decarboxylase family protein [Gammaproteobacteria bacterium]